MSVKETFKDVATVDIEGDGFPFSANYEAGTAPSTIARVLQQLQRTDLVRGKFQANLGAFFSGAAGDSVEVFDNITLKKDDAGFHIELRQ